MKSIFKVVGCIILILLPIAFVYGFIRVGWLGFPQGTYTLTDVNGDGLIDKVVVDSGGFLPDGKAFVNLFIGIPSYQEHMQPALDLWKDSLDFLKTTPIDSIGTFFAQAGNLFRIIGAFFMNVWFMIGYPFKVLIYIFGTLFTPYQG